MACGPKRAPAGPVSAGSNGSPTKATSAPSRLDWRGSLRNVEMPTPWPASAGSAGPNPFMTYPFLPAKEVFRRGPKDAAAGWPRPAFASRPLPWFILLVRGLGGPAATPRLAGRAQDVAVYSLH